MHFPVPNLTTALTGPLLEVEKHFLKHQIDIETWFRSEWQKTPAPFYTSVDLRNSGFKLAPVDTNLFPAGFNNLNPDFEALCVNAIQMAVERICPQAASILIIPENHTRNLFYLENVAALKRFIQKAGFKVRIASLLPEITEPTDFNLPSGQVLTLEPIKRKNNQVGVDDFFPCSVILNNDLSAGRPEILENLDQFLMPPLELGWINRQKSEHFDIYHQVAKEFATQVNIDPWLINPYFAPSEQIDFKSQAGIEQLAKKVDDVIARIQSKYDQYQVDKEPFVIVKADSGTYGMSIMTVHRGEDLLSLNRKQRNKMASSKEGLGVSNVLIQEGVYTFETLGEAVAEPVVYMMDHFVVGGFYRVHKNKGINENLNAPGMHFEPLAFADSCVTPDAEQYPDASPNRFYAYGVVARLAMLAAAREIFIAKENR